MDAEGVRRDQDAARQILDELWINPGVHRDQEAALQILDDAEGVCRDQDTARQILDELKMDTELELEAVCRDQEVARQILDELLINLGVRRAAPQILVEPGTDWSGAHRRWQAARVAVERAVVRCVQ
jgi:hypothetical protein